MVLSPEPSPLSALNGNTHETDLAISVLFLTVSLAPCLKHRNWTAYFKTAAKSSTQLHNFSLTTNFSYQVSLDVSSMHPVVAHTTRSLGKSLNSFSKEILFKASSFSPPKKPGVEDVTGEYLIQRSDDNVETLRKRLATYHAQTGPVAEYYKSKGLWKGIDAAQSPTVVWDNLWSIFKK